MNATITALRDKLKCLVDECTFDERCGCLAEISATFDAKDAEIEQLRAALAPFHQYVEQNDLTSRDPGDAIEVPIVNLLAASLAFAMSGMGSRPSRETPTRPGERIIEATREIAQRHR